MEPLSRWFDRFLFPPPSLGPGDFSFSHGGGQVCTVIGSGGKTSLIWLLARSQRQRKVLVSPTAKMYPPSPELRWYDRYFPGGDIPADPPGAESGGVTLAGILNGETGKLEALPPGELEALVSRHDLTLLEGDGSAGLPLKGWADHEPAVPPCTAVTVGLIPVTPLGGKVSAEIIFRLPQFLRLSGAKEGDTLSPAHLAGVITGRAGRPGGGNGNGGGRGLFSAAQGEKLLFFNQADDEARLDQARSAAALLPGDFRTGLAGIIAGSVERDGVEVLYFPHSRT
jgi:probable selenium-dependent hydroxylase accessory protein YqeC